MSESFPRQTWKNLAMCPNSNETPQYPIGYNIDTMSPYATLFAYFGVSIKF